MLAVLADKCPYAVQCFEFHDRDELDLVVKSKSFAGHRYANNA